MGILATVMSLVPGNVRGNQRGVCRGWQRNDSVVPAQLGGTRKALAPAWDEWIKTAEENGVSGSKGTR
jgi:hypothetical protein